MINYYITSHAKERLRQRFGIESIDVAQQWINEKMSKAVHHRNDGIKKVYQVADIEIILDGNRVVTIKPLYGETSIMKQLRGVVEKEISKVLTVKERAFRKAEIEVAEITVNFLRARNPKTKALVQRRLTKAIDIKEQLNTEIVGIKKAAEHYGVDA
jgi:hypothetical protein